MAFRLGAVFVDFRCAIGQYAQENNLIIDMCYEEHPAHPLRIISFGIGQSLGKMIKEGRFKKTIHNSHNNSYKFRIYTSENWPNFKKELRKNSLMRETFSVLRSEDSVYFQEGICLGYYINIMNTYCTAILEDACGNIIFRTRLYYQKSDVGLQKIFIPIPDGLRGSRLVCGSGADADANGAQSQRYDGSEVDFILSISQICLIEN